MILHVPCKINIGLDILCRRPDGFHDVESWMVPVPTLYDRIRLERAEEEATVLETTGLALDCPPHENLAYRAWDALRKELGAGPVAMRIEKHIPFGAGLGGGSADAGAVLTGLNALFSLGLSEAQLRERAARLGSDVPFFVNPCPQLATGRGERMRPFARPLDGMWIVIVKPPFGIPTAEAYRLIRPERPARPLAERLQRPLAEWRAGVVNAFERVLFGPYPRLASLRDSLLAAGACYASLSGSGSALFGLFDHRPDYSAPADCFLHIGQL